MTLALATITGAEWNKQGITREVFLTRRYAIKIPKLKYGWHKFLCGLLANMQERQFAAAGWPELGPVVFSAPGGWLVVMRRAEMLTDVEWRAFDPKKFCETPDYTVPAEFKQDSFGKVDGKIVAIDMCESIWIKRTGRPDEVIENVGDAKRALGDDALVWDDDVDLTNPRTLAAVSKPTCCLCSMDMKATAKRAGYIANNQHGGDPFEWHFSKIEQQ